MDVFVKGEIRHIAQMSIKPAIIEQEKLLSLARYLVDFLGEELRFVKAERSNGSKRFILIEASR